MAILKRTHDDKWYLDNGVQSSEPVDKAEMMKILMSLGIKDPEAKFQEAIRQGLAEVDTLERVS